MKFDHMVKVNGQYYPAGTEIPEPDVCIEQVEEVEEIHETEPLILEADSTESSPAKRGRKAATSQ